MKIHNKEIQLTERKAADSHGLAAYVSQHPEIKAAVFYAQVVSDSMKATYKNFSLIKKLLYRRHYIIKASRLMELLSQNQLLDEFCLVMELEGVGTAEEIKKKAMTLEMKAE